MKHNWLVLLRVPGLPTALGVELDHLQKKKNSLYEEKIVRMNPPVRDLKRGRPRRTPIRGFMGLSGGPADEAAPLFKEPPDGTVIGGD